MDFDQFVKVNSTLLNVIYSDDYTRMIFLGQPEIIRSNNGKYFLIERENRHYGFNREISMEVLNKKEELETASNSVPVFIHSDELEVYFLQVKVFWIA